MSDDLRNCVSGDPKFVELWRRICDEADTSEREWIANLRDSGFKAAHPNDGWVDRKNNEVHFAYPQFNDGANAGDKVMLGWPGDPKSYRPIRLVELRPTFAGGQWWKFEDAP